MSRIIVIVAAVFSSPSLLLVDSAVKGTALLILATVAAVVLRRDSAATRHLVWLMAIVAMLAVPILSAMLPKWRVLPEWTAISLEPGVGDLSSSGIVRSPRDAVALPESADPDIVFEMKSTSAFQTVAEPLEIQSAMAVPESIPDSPVWSLNWLNTLPLVWAIGFCVLILRLIASRLMLWNKEWLETVICSSACGAGFQPAGMGEKMDPRLEAYATYRDPIVTALEAASLQLGMRRPVTLLIHPGNTIPIVWGIFRFRLLLSESAQHWSSEQLRSVFLHELAHIKRRDTIAQLLTQVVCALHWFNPLVWFAAWRIGVERERACDDLVLASGVRPSAYAGHLLEVVSGLAPDRWTQSCGLAMARSSSIESRLVAVLSENLNRRGVSVALAAIALTIAVGIAVPIAMLRAADEPEKQPQTQQPNEGVIVQTAIEQKLKWGEPTNGLRMALAWPPSLGEPRIGVAEEFYLVVQNVSPTAVRLAANDSVPNPRRLILLSIDGPLSALNDTVTMPGDWLLQPREVAFLRLFKRPEASQDEHKTESVIENNIRVFPNYSMKAEMNIEKSAPGVWSGKLVTGETRGSVDVIPPKHKDAQALFKSWTTAARADGRIPGAVIAQLGQNVTTFMKYNPTSAATPQLEKMMPRFDGSRDWSGQDAVTLLDELAAVQDSPITAALDHENMGVIRSGTALPVGLANAPWGEALANGLRHAWLLEPQAAEHRLGTPLNARVLVHNASKVAVVFRTRSWHQLGHKARDAKGADVNVDSTFWTTRGQLTLFRLAPGEFIELNGPGIGIGPVGNREDWQQTRVGSWVEAKAGDDVTVTTEPLPLNDWNDKPELDGEQRWWLDHITARLSRHLPFPAGKTERELLLYRVAMELFGTPVSNEVNATFVGDTTPNALDSLAKNLFHRPGPDLNVWAGPLSSGPTKFRVLPADPDAAKKPRTAYNPGRYTLNENAVLSVTRRRVGERIVNEAHIQFFSVDPTRPSPGEPREIKLPAGYDTWAAAWVRGGTMMWVQTASGVSSYDYSNPAKVNEQTAELEQIPADIRLALQGVMIVSDPQPVQKPIPSTSPPASSSP